MPRKGRVYSGFQLASSGRKRGKSDLEKESFRRCYPSDSEDDDQDVSASTYSSRSTSSSTQPILNNAYSRRSKTPFLFRAPHSVMRWSCLVLGAAVLIFMFTLAHLSWSSARKVQTELESSRPHPPAPWEVFPFLERYYGGVRSLVSRNSSVPEYPSASDQYPNNNTITTTTTTTEQEPQSQVSMHAFNPYPDYSSEAYTGQYPPKVDCFLDKENKIHIPSVRTYTGIPRGLPDPVLGTNALFNMRDDICFDRFGRLGPYGLGYSLNRGGSGAAMAGDRDAIDDVWRETPEVDYRGVRWAETQARCAMANKDRFIETPSVELDRSDLMHKDGLRNRADRQEDQSPEGRPRKDSGSREEILSKLARNAVVIRTWSDYDYTTEDIIYLRSIVAELSLNSGSEYAVHFLIQVKDDNAPIWSDKGTYERVLRDSLPPEFLGMGSLWSERQMNLLYGGLAESFYRNLPVHGVYRSSFMPLQYFAHTHPEYDFIWNWEMDVRYTGHWYHLFDSVSKWAKAQPRKGLWERNSRFYVPSEHGSWLDFSHMVRVQTQHGTNSPNNMWSGLPVHGDSSSGFSPDKREGDKPIWGPERPLDDDNTSFDTDPVPPTSFEADKSQWGVGEDADLITFNPLFDPAGTTWLLAEDVTGYNTSRSLPPRRAATITASRLSRRLLTTMHREVSLNRHTMFTEMWPASCALHHGLKAVYAPHAEYIDRRWPTGYLEATLNAGRNGATGGARTSVFGEPEHNFKGTTWYYNAGFPEVLWHRWLGYRFNNDGGEEFEVNGVGMKGGGEGRMCLPAMLLHPVKRVDMAIEGLRD